jgi:hypothetical protein
VPSPFGQVAGAIGDFGSQFGEANEISQQWKSRAQQMAFEQARQKLAAIMAPLQLQELQRKIQTMNQPQQNIIGLPGGGTGILPINPTGGHGPVETVVPGKKPSLKEQFENETDPAKKLDLLDQLKQEAGAVTGAKRNPQQQLQQEANDAYDSGDMDTYAKKLKQIQDLSSASKATSAPSKISLILKANQGDPEAQAALKKLQDMDAASAEARGIGFGKGRAAYQVGAYLDDTGQLVPMSNLDAVNAIHAGKNLTPAGKLSPKDAIAFQQFASEAAPAFAMVRQSAKAFDNPEDRAIFARILGSAGTPPVGGESQWLGNVLNQALTSGLSPEGRQEAIAASRVNETVGRMRSILGLPATESAMELTLALTPGPATPDSKYVVGYTDKDGNHVPGKLDILEQMANLATQIPAVGNALPPSMRSTSSVKPTSNTPPPGAKIRDFTQIGPN